MTNNTALSAMIGQIQSAGQIAENVTFIDEEHKEIFLTYLQKYRYGDVYHAALVLWQRIALQFLGIDAETRKILKQFMTLNTSLQLFTKIKIQTHLFIV